MILVQNYNPMLSLTFDSLEIKSISHLLKSPPAMGLSAALLAALSAWAAGWPPIGVMVNASLAAMIASFLSSYLQSKAD